MASINKRERKKWHVTVFGRIDLKKIFDERQQAQVYVSELRDNGHSPR